MIVLPRWRIWQRLFVLSMALVALDCRPIANIAPAAHPIVGPVPGSADIIVRVLDVSQGDAILIENGSSRVVIDGGPLSGRFGRYLDRYNWNGATLDAVILTHAHADHYQGLRELFRSSRHIRVRTFFENRDPGLSSSLLELRDSLRSRVDRGEMLLRDTDDPCSDGSAVCSIPLSGGAHLEIMRPDPRGDSPNNRSAALKLVGPDSSAFSMWLAGDAERQEIDYFGAEYVVRPGMQSSLLKANHHGSCNGVTNRYLDMVQPRVVIMSLAARNSYGFAQLQTLELLRDRGIRWYRTDVNGTITIRAGAGISRGFEVSAERGQASTAGRGDQRSAQPICRSM